MVTRKHDKQVEEDPLPSPPPPTDLISLHAQLESLTRSMAVFPTFIKTTNQPLAEVSQFMIETRSTLAHQSTVPFLPLSAPFSTSPLLSEHLPSVLLTGPSPIAPLQPSSSSGMSLRVSPDRPLPAASVPLPPIDPCLHGLFSSQSTISPTPPIPSGYWPGTTTTSWTSHPPLSNLIPSVMPTGVVWTHSWPHTHSGLPSPSHSQPPSSVPPPPLPVLLAACPSPTIPSDIPGYWTRHADASHPSDYRGLEERFGSRLGGESRFHSPKLDLPLFNGTDPDEWLFGMDRYFSVNHI